MNPRQSLSVATAALRWSTARERRLAAAKEKRRFDVIYAADRMNIAVWRAQLDANTAYTEARRREQATARALAKACAKARGDLQAADAFRAPRPQVGLSPGMTLEIAP